MVLNQPKGVHKSRSMKTLGGKRYMEYGGHKSCSIKIYIWITARNFIKCLYSLEWQKSHLGALAFPSNLSMHKNTNACTRCCPNSRKPIKKNPVAPVDLIKHDAYNHTCDHMEIICLLMLLQYFIDIILWQKLASMDTVARHRFHHDSIALSSQYTNVSIGMKNSLVWGFCISTLSDNDRCLIGL